MQKIATCPLYDADKKEIVSLQSRISACRSKIADESLSVNHPDLLALETFVRNLAHSAALIGNTKGAEAEALLNRGEALYKTR